MNIRDVIKQKINTQIYGGSWKNEAFRINYLNTLEKQCSKKGVLTGGLVEYNQQQETISPDDVKQETGIAIKDTFENRNTNSIMYGKNITEYAKQIISQVIKFYTDKELAGLRDVQRKIQKYLQKIENNQSLKYEKLLKMFSAKSPECLLAYMLISYHSKDLDLLLRTAYTFGRVIPLKSKNEWYDNYRLSAYGNVLNMVMWKDFDRDDVYTIDENAHEINTNRALLYPCRILKFLVGSLRAFICIHDLFPSNLARLKDLTSFKYGTQSTHHANLTEEIVCDKAYKHYPYFFGGAHGCDVFHIRDMSVSIEEIDAFLDRYRNARVGYILNTATYSSGHGEHWVALELTYKKAKLICSQKSEFSVFKDQRFVNELKQLGYSFENNTEEIQNENYGCGAYAFISLLELLRFGDIKRAVSDIGFNMENLGKSVGRDSNIDIVREKLAGWEN